MGLCCTGLLLLLLLLLLLSGVAHGARTGLFSSILNLTSNAEISTNATCGEPEAETYCKLVEHVPDGQRKHPQCRTCHSESADPRERHPITNAIDGTNAWWQSPSIKNGHQFHWVTITLDLKQVFQVAYVIVKAANSPRPGNWILERSVDGLRFQPWQYYAVSDAECLTRYNMTPRTGQPTYRTDSEVICTSFYSRLVPLEHGEIHTSLINGRPSADDPTPKLQKFTSARYIRLRLQRIRTLNADLMALSYRDPHGVDPIVTQRYYYSIKDISVGGMCICYGHAKSCPWDPVTKKLRCICEHNTCGENCRECCPGYHQEPWQPGTRSDGNTCEKCNCHNKTEECYYNVTVAAAKMSVNTHGHFAGGGACLNCGQNTAGVNCESCVDGFFRPSEVSPYEEEPCVQCACDSRGSLSQTCIRDNSEADPSKGLLPGHCLCEVGFAGPQCNRCAPGFHSFPTCTPCSCSLDGSLGRDPCSDCVCKANVMGPDCDRCRPGFYNLQGSNPEGCTECFCFGLSNVCNSTTWSWSKVVHKDARLLPLHSAALTDAGNGSASGSAAPLLLSWAAPQPFLGNKLTSYGGFLNYSVSWGFLPESDDGGESFPSLFHIVIEGNGRSLRQAIPDELAGAPQQEQLVAVEIVPWILVDDVSGRTVQQDELMSVLVNVSGLWIRARAEASAGAPLRLSSVALETADAAGNSWTVARSVELCECPWGYAGTSCEQCLPEFYRVDGVLFGGNCLKCECHGHASRCDADGRCVGCEHNTWGPHCDQCLPGFYGNALAGTPEDCRRCSCPLTAEQNNFSPTCHVDGEEVVCDQCQQGYSGPRCERCADGYYGEPGVPGRGCARCDCNGNVDPAETGNCDPHSGECLKCVGHTAGGHCERCQSGFFGDAIAAKNCTPCGCHELGSVSSDCDENTGRCACRPNVAGEKCDACDVGHYGLLSGKGCILCNCSHTGALSQECSEGGACECARGVAGDKCDRCTRGHYGTVDTNCTECDCEHTHGNCHPTTGECVCPPHTRGGECELCENGHWGHDLETGCKPCDCSTVGSLDSQCHPTSGQCQCGPQFSGLRCERCALGFSVFPECTVCVCNIQGTREEFCDEGRTLCGCDQSGVCVCKENAGGPQCDRCKRGTFGLAADHRDGCRPCFCSGVSSECQELEGLLRVPVALDTETEHLRLVHVENVSADDGTALSIVPVQDSSPTGRLYWLLPPTVQGNKLLSYGGQLRYTSSTTPPEGLRAGIAEPPLILMQGGQLPKQLLYLDAPPPEGGQEVMAEVLMTEHKWKHFASRQEVNRAEFMSVLTNVELVLIKASGGSGISNVSLETAVEEADAAGGGERARFVEKCLCPLGYGGLSCQSCAAGHHREVAPLQPTAAEQPHVHTCVPCQCNNHSASCDVDTGSCQDCQHNTTGAHCHICAPGYYGKVEGSIHDCFLCACPPGNTQSFSATCVLGGSAGFYCDACELGYEGPHCDRCSAAHYGDPLQVDGRCRPCQCSEEGSLSPHCHPLTGQCECRAGVGGRRCTECQESHALQDGRCIPCDDGCVTLLLDTLAHLEQRVQQPVNLSASVLVPHGYLRSVLDDTAKFRTLLSPENQPDSLLQVAEEHLARLSEDIPELHGKALKLFGAAEELAQSAEQRLGHSKELLDLISSLHSAASALEEEASMLNATLDKTMDMPSSIQFMEQMLQAMREVGLAHNNVLVSDELSAAAALLLRVQTEFLKPVRSTDALKDTRGLVSALDLQLQDAKEQLLVAQAQNNHTFQLLDRISSQLDHLSELREERVHALNRQAASCAEEAQDILALVPIALENTNSSFALLEAAQEELDSRSTLLKDRVSTLTEQMEKIPEVVHRAEDHAQQLDMQALGLHTALLSARNISARATSAISVNSNIRTAVEEAELLGGSAHTTASTVHTMTPFLAASARDRRVQGVQQSQEILAESAAASAESDGLSANITDLGARVNLVRHGVRDATSRLPGPPAVSAPEGSSSRISQVKEQVATATGSLQATLALLEDLGHRLDSSSSTLDRAAGDVAAAKEQLRASEETVHEMETALREVEANAERLLGRLGPLRALGEHLSHNLSHIQLLIQQTRLQAASVKVAVSAQRDCVRSYRPRVSSGNSNSVTVTVRSGEPTNLLFYLGSNSSKDFMALEMHDGKVSFLWDVGSGHARLEYSDTRIDNNKWHHIKARRFGRRGSLMVQELHSDPRPPVKALSPGSSTVLEVQESTLVFVGGLSNHIVKSEAVQATQFSGCVAEASLNGKAIGLWNYAERWGTCQGCPFSPQVDEASFQFSGTDFSVVETAVSPSSTHLIMQFKTASPGGLLLYLTSNSTKDFLSIELVEGRVRLTFELGSGVFTLTTSKVYNTGSWYTLVVQRKKRKAELTVTSTADPSDPEHLEGESPGGASDLNRSNRDPIYIGGLPQATRVMRPHAPGFYVGCLRNVEVSRSRLDLLQKAHGVSKGCDLGPVHSVTVLSGGFLQLPPLLLDQETEVMATFSTHWGDGLILLGFEEAGGRQRRRALLPSLAVLLLSGRLEVHLDAGEAGNTHSVVLHARAGTLSDGQEHSLLLNWSNRTLMVVLDDDPGPTFLSPERDFPSLSTVFAGGVPSESFTAHLKTSSSFRGCISNVVVNAELLDFTVLRHHNVDMGSCQLDPAPVYSVSPDYGEPRPTVEPTIEPTTGPTAGSTAGPTAGPAVLLPAPSLTPAGPQCGAEDHNGSVSGALHFGLHIHSHIALNITQHAIRNSFSLLLSVRTFAPSGLLFYLGAPNQGDYATLQLHGGQLFFTCDLGRNAATATLQRPVDDGQWHSVKADFGKKRVTLTVDGLSSGPVLAKGKTSTLDVEGKIYLGGLPSNYKARNIGNVTHSIAGCLKDVVLNDEPLDMDRPVSSLATTGCFAAVQQGSFFNGTGFGAFAKEGYKVGLDITVALEFRTTAPVGVILGVSGDKSDAIGLELVNGQVVFHVDNGAGRFSAYDPGAPGHVCDGNWHTVSAVKSRRGLSLAVDGKMVRRANPYPRASSADTKSPIYVGGLPSGLRMSCLTVETPFRGCMRNLHLTRGPQLRNLDFSKAFRLHGVIPHSCPAPVE